jgi:hypothetical protein
VAFVCVEEETVVPSRDQLDEFVTATWTSVAELIVADRPGQDAVETVR